MTNKALERFSGPMPTLHDAVRLDRLYLAWAKVQSNGGGPGADQMTLARFAPIALQRLTQLRRDVETGFYQPGPYRRLDIPKKSGGVRTLSIPSVIDRILHTALANALTPLFELEFESSSYGYRKGRSTAQAVARVEALRRQGYKWTVDADIERFFDSVRLNSVMDAVTALVPDQEMTGLIADILSHASPAGRGLPQGSPLSPLLSNLVLDGLDEAFEGKGARIIRFADDFVILCKSEKRAAEALAGAGDILADLGLRLNMRKTRLLSYNDGLNFLGKLFVRSLVLDRLEEDDTPAQPRAAGVVSVQPGSAPVFADAEKAEEDADELPGNPDRDPLPSPRLRTLYVYEPGTELDADGWQFVARRGGVERLRLTSDQVDQIDIGPQAEITTRALRLAGGSEIAVILSDGWGHVAHRMSPSGFSPGDEGGPAALHLQQAEASLNPERRLSLARPLVIARLKSQRAQLRRLFRTAQQVPDPNPADAYASILRKVTHTDSINGLTGLEGRATALYWPALGACLRYDWVFSKRTRQPPSDPFSALLSFLSMRLTQDVESLIGRHGLHPGFSVLHAPGDRKRPSLALDLMEPFRVPLVEGLAVQLVNQRVVKANDVSVKPKGVKFEPGVAARLVRAYEDRAGGPVKSPFTGQRVSWRGLMEHQIIAWQQAIAAGRVPDVFEKIN